MNDILFHKLEALVIDALGIRIADREAAVVKDAVAHRMRALAIDDPTDYLSLLESLDGSAGGEWSNFAGLITNRESYFFRDKGQMDLLRGRILPELIEHARLAGTKLRIWSAGCSTGEEPYSVAMLVNDLHPTGKSPDVEILGTDISPAALARARDGVYGSWSFRMVDPAIRDRYFRGNDTEWTLDPAVRAMVRFRAGNLTREVVAGEIVSDVFDLILCRNVFIYLDQSAITAAVGIFARSLRAGGYLMTGHSELNGIDLQGLEQRRFAESLLYRRPEPADAVTARQAGNPDRPQTEPSGRSVPTLEKRGRQVGMAPSHAAAPPRASRTSTGSPSRASSPPGTASRDAEVRPVAEEVDAFIDDASRLIDAGRNEEVIARGTPLADAGKGGAPLLYLLATAHANRGDYEKGSALGSRAIAADRMHLPSYYLLAQIAESRDDKAEARRLLNNVLYLAPMSAAAYVFLADGETSTARRDHLRRMALDLLERLPVDTPVEGYPGVNAGELRLLLRNQLSGASAR